MFPKLLGTILILILIPGGRSVLQTKHSSIEAEFEKGLSAPPSVKHDLVIQLAIFTDTEFNNLFQNDRNRILQYWEAILYDVHLKFKTLPSFNISLRVTSLSNYQDREEHATLGIGSSPQEPQSQENIASNFELFSYSKIGQIPNFDIAVLALGTHLPENKNLACFAKGPICHGQNDEAQRWQNIVILGMDKHPAGQLAKQIACVLGAPSQDDFDDHLYFLWANCNHTPNNAVNCCLLGKSRPWSIVEPSFFCPCTNQLLATKLSKRLLEKPACMNRTMTEKNPLVDAEKLFQNPRNVPRYSMKQQCQLLARDAHATVELGSCYKVECWSNLNQRMLSFSPLDGTPCGFRGNGQCLRSHCVEPIMQLVNVGTGKCLIPETSLFELHDKPVLKDCSSIDMHIWDSNEYWEEGTISMMYSTKVGMELKHLNLRLDSEQKAASTFEQNISDNAVQWLFERVGDLQKPEFILMQSETRFCAVAADDGINLEFVANCSSDDAKARWKFVTVGESLSGSRHYQVWYLLWDNVALTLLLLVILIVLWVSRKMGWWSKQEMAKGIKKLKIRITVLRNGKVKTEIL